METFNEAIQKRDFVLTAELNLVRESDAASIVDQATVLATHTDAIQIPDNPNARIHMTPLAASSILLKHGIEAIAQLSCRDRNRVALENELLSLGAMGVRNLLLLRGDDLSECVTSATGWVWAKPTIDLLTGYAITRPLELYLPYWPFEPFLPIFIIALGTFLVRKKYANSD